MGIKANIFNIQHFSVHDGLGVRTVVFFKGCSLHCRWCHNPESIHAAKEILLYPDRCICLLYTSETTVETTTVAEESTVAVESTVEETTVEATTEEAATETATETVAE